MKILDLRQDLSSYAIRITIKLIELKFVKWQVMMQREAVNYYYDIYISEMQIRMRFVVRKNLFEMLKGKEKKSVGMYSFYRVDRHVWQ